MTPPATLVVLAWLYEARAERDSLRAQLAAMGRVVEAAREFMAAYPGSVPLGPLFEALRALDASGPLTQEAGLRWTKEPSGDGYYWARWESFEQVDLYDVATIRGVLMCRDLGDRESDWEPVDAGWLPPLWCGPLTPPGER